MYLSNLNDILMVYYMPLKTYQYVFFCPEIKKKNLVFFYLEIKNKDKTDKN